MDRKQIAVRLTIDALGLPFAMNTFDERLVLQKAVYLGQAAGVKLGYYFSWYLRGPYCSPLAADAFCVAEELTQDTDDWHRWKLDEESNKRLNEVKDLVDLHGDLEKAAWLELLASIHFLLKTKQASADDSAGLAETLKRYGKDYESSEVRRAVSALRRKSLL